MDPSDQKIAVRHAMNNPFAPSTRTSTPLASPCVTLNPSA